MPRGGSRQGAGRKKGSKPRMTQLRERITARELSNTEVTPLHVLLQCMMTAWGRGDQDKAAQFAEKAAPFVHPRLSTTQVSGDPEKPLETVTRIELVAPRALIGHRPA